MQTRFDIVFIRIPSVVRSLFHTYTLKRGWLFLKIGEKLKSCNAETIARFFIVSLFDLFSFQVKV